MAQNKYEVTVKKLHNIMLASILCVGMHSALAETGETSTVVDTGGGATQELDATDATLQALVEQIALLSVKERKDLFQKVREMCVPNFLLFWNFEILQISKL